MKHNFVELLLTQASWVAHAGVFPHQIMTNVISLCVILGLKFHQRKMATASSTCEKRSAIHPMLHPVVRCLKTADDYVTDRESSDDRSTVDNSVSDYSMNSRTPFLEDCTKLTENDIDILLQKAGLESRCHGSTSNSISGLERRGECRVGQCRLPCLQPCATIASFTIMCCMLATLNGALTAGYVNSVITTIEKRFEIGSSYSGLIAAAVELGGVMAVIFVSYFGSQRHIPNWIGFGALITGVGALVFTLPHMMAPAYTITGGLNSSRISEHTCKSRASESVVDDDDEESDADANSCIDKESGQFSYVMTLVMAQMLIGIGGSPLYTLGTTYIDNHVTKLKAPSYIGMYFDRNRKLDISIAPTKARSREPAYSQALIQNKIDRVKSRESGRQTVRRLWWMVFGVETWREVGGRGQIRIGFVEEQCFKFGVKEL